MNVKIRSNPKPKIINKKQLIKKADTVFSKYIRTKYEINGLVPCYTCGKKLEYAKSQCGHFESRSFHSIRFDENNARVQCYGCNCAKSGNYKVYTLKLLNEIGIYGIEFLATAKNEKKLYFVDCFENKYFTDLNEVIKYYEKKLKEL
jgi:GTPase SAR1 family protein